MTEIRVSAKDTTNSLGKQIEQAFCDKGAVTLYTDDANQYNIAVKAVANARQALVTLGVDLAAETYFQDNEGRYEERHKLKIVLSNKT